MQPIPELVLVVTCPNKTNPNIVFQNKTIWKRTQTRNSTKNKTDHITNAGRHSMACFLRTEKPPWVLVSEAVKTLLNEWTGALGGSAVHGSGFIGSSCYNTFIPLESKQLGKRIEGWSWKYWKSKGHLHPYIRFRHQSDLCVNLIRFLLSLKHAKIQGKLPYPLPVYP